MKFRIIGNPALIGYPAFKGALIPAMKSMTLELISKSIRVNCILLSHEETEMVNKILEKLSKKLIMAMH